MMLLNSLKIIFLSLIIVCVIPFLVENIKIQYSSLLEPQAHVGVLSITKPLHDAHDFTQHLHSFFKNPIIQAIVIKIDCAETAPGTSQTIFHDIRQLKKEYSKPIVALIENRCLSGAYLIASACDHIIAPESALIGNIGQNFCNWSTHNTVTANDNIDAINNESYQQLTKQIALSRKLSLTTTGNWAQGKIFTGSQALALGLINEIGSLCNIIKIIKEKAFIETEITWVEPPQKHLHLFNTFFGNENAVA